ncbi:MAG: tRNA pseudouridine(13) synthase TruD [bacterium]|nr:tRNA pseudouridine(13) synthase TruD [bacterium]
MNWSPFLLTNLPFVHGEPVCSAVLRAEPEDFQVDEILGFPPSGEGEHVFLQIRKRNQNTAWVAEQLAKAAGLKPDAVSYAGLKDRRAVTTQWFSLHLPGKSLPDLSAFWSEDIQLVTQTFNQRKLKRGAHQGNRFVITLRDVEGDHAAVESRLEQIAAQGVPNYFGPQRFGHDNGNLQAGEALLQQKPRRRLNYRESIALSALRSALFNGVLGERIRQKNWNTALPGDVLMLDGRGSFFRPEADDTAIGQRLENMELHLTGPMPGKGTPVVSADVAALEQGVLSDCADLLRALEAFGVDAQRRALRLRAADLGWEWLDESSLRLAFALPSGAFATSVLRELATLRQTGLDAIPVE